MQSKDLDEFLEGQDLSPEEMELVRKKLSEIRQNNKTDGNKLPNNEKKISKSIIGVAAGTFVVVVVLVGFFFTRTALETTEDTEAPSETTIYSTEIPSGTKMYPYSINLVSSGGKSYEISFISDVKKMEIRDDGTSTIQLVKDGDRMFSCLICLGYSIGDTKLTQETVSNDPNSTEYDAGTLSGYEYFIENAHGYVFYDEDKTINISGGTDHYISDIEITPLD